MSTKKNKHKSLTDKVSESFVPRPLADPELDSEDETIAKFAEFVEDENLDVNQKISDIRKRNIKTLSEYSDKYRGKVASRKELEGDNVEIHSQGTSEDDPEDDLEEYRKKLKKCQIDSGPDESLGTEEESSEDDAEEVSNEEQDSDYDSACENMSEGSQIDDEIQPIPSSSDLLKEKDQGEEVQRGLAVQNQLKLWEKLLEVRIHSQKMLIKANSLPFHQTFEQMSNKSEEFRELVRETQENTSNLLSKLLEMQNALAQQYSETKNVLKARRKLSTTKEDSLEEPPVKKFAPLIEDNHKSFLPYRNSVLQKWYDRTKILTPGAGAKGRKSNSDNFDVIKKIETVLLNKDELIKKSQVIKGNYILFGQKQSEDNILQGEGTKSETTSHSEIFDDTDFYHQQLRELIEYKTNTASSPLEMSKQLIELQKLRQKMKKKVDTRASKGRKIRYVVHNKLINFMAPQDNSEWTDESKDELYRSLFAT